MGRATDAIGHQNRNARRTDATSAMSIWGFQGWRVVAACFVIASVAWSLGLFGASVYLQAVTAEHGWAISTVASAITVFYLTSAALQRTVAAQIQLRGPRPILTIGALSMCTGVALIGQVTMPWHLYGCFVLVGIGWSTLSTTGLSATVAPWFERHQGRSMTLAIMGASLGAMLGVPALLYAISSLGLSRGLATAALVAALIMLPLILRVLRFARPKQIGQERDGGPNPHAPIDSGAYVVPIAQTGRPRILLWTAAAGFGLGLMMQIGFATHHVALAMPLMSARDAGLLVSGTGLTGLIGRLVLARIVDHVPVRVLAVAAMLVQSMSLLAIALWPSMEVLFVASLFYGYCVGHVTTLGPVVVRREFGAQAFARSYGAAATLIQFTSAMGPAVFGFMRDGFGGYRPGMAIAACVTLIGALCLLAGGRWGRRAASTPTAADPSLDNERTAL